MARRSLKLDEFIAEYRFWGEWEILYTDETHLKKCEYVKLGEIRIDASKETAQNYPVLPFVFLPVTGEDIESSFSELIETRLSDLSTQQKKLDQTDASNQQKDALKKKADALKQQADTLKEQAKRLIYGQLVDSMVRTGLLRPEFWLMEEQIIKMEFLEVMRKLSKHVYLTFVVDTSALRRATISFLHKTLSEVPIWTGCSCFCDDRNPASGTRIKENLVQQQKQN